MPTEVAVIDAHGRHAQTVCFTKDGKLLVSAGQDAHIRLWSVPGFSAAGSFAGHKNSVNSLSFSDDDRLLATGSTDGTVRIWSYPDGRCLHSLAGQLTGVFAPAGDLLATITPKGKVTLWDATSGKQIRSIPPVDKRGLTIAFSPDGANLLIGGTGPIHRLAVMDGTKVGELAGHKVIVACLRVSPNGKLLASTGADGHLRLWSTKDWSEVRAVKLDACGVLQIAFTPKSDIVTVAADYLIQSYRVKDGKPVGQIELPLKGLYGLAYAPDAKYLANAAADGRIRVWKLTA